MIIVSKKSQYITSIVINTIFLILCSLCIILLITIVSISLTNEKVIVNQGYSILPLKIDFTAYKFIFRNPSSILKAYAVSITVSVGGCLSGLLISSMFSYAISRRNFYFRRVFTGLIIFPMLFSGGLVPFYILVVRYLNLKDNILATILPYLVIPIYIIIMRTFFMTIPSALIESAKLDGANEIMIFFKIIIPLSKPSFATVGLLMLLIYWNDWYLPLLFINDPEIYSLQLLLNNMLSNAEMVRQNLVSSSLGIKASDLPTEGARMAMCVLAAGPMLFVLPFFQKYFVKGLTIGSVKE